MGQISFAKTVTNFVPKSDSLSAKFVGQTYSEKIGTKTIGQSLTPGRYYRLSGNKAILYIFYFHKKYKDC